MAKHLDEYSFDGLRLIVPTWTDSALKELAAKIKKTLQVHGDKMTEKYFEDMHRKLSIVRNELYRRIEAANYSKAQNHGIQERFINDKVDVEEPFKLVDSRGRAL